MHILKYYETILTFFIETSKYMYLTTPCNIFERRLFFCQLLTFKFTESRHASWSMLLITSNHLNINMFAQAILARVLKNTELRLIRTWLETGSFLT